MTSDRLARPEGTATPAVVPSGRRLPYRRRLRAITMRWIWLVPS
ncbi:hypothetical protein LY71_101269 [Geodermatophilus tzadiensis]|uniref:Uncharacterized protein n=1 Tax=Geodermatophilus tzadiensis TaxID=1137988 RepID=A0A2T0U1W1_9ACTN|nr:hypothetical protein LY71_101269 [Geodermatophilus tzadiensis]